MSRLLAALAALLLLAGAARAQDAKKPVETKGAVAPAETKGASAPATELPPETKAAIEREVERLKEEIRDEVRAEIQGAQSAAEFTGRRGGGPEARVPRARRLLPRARPALRRLRPRTPAGRDWPLHLPGPAREPDPVPGGAGASRATIATANMRLRLEPTMNVSELVRVRAQIDVLDNYVLGSSTSRLFDDPYSPYPVPFYGSTRQLYPGDPTADRDPILPKRVWGEVQTPVGLLSFGRMPSAWGLGILTNAGGGVDDDLRRHRRPDPVRAAAPADADWRAHGRPHPRLRRRGRAPRRPALRRRDRPAIRRGLLRRRPHLRREGGAAWTRTTRSAASSSGTSLRSTSARTTITGRSVRVSRPGCRTASGRSSIRPRPSQWASATATATSSTSGCASSRQRWRVEAEGVGVYGHIGTAFTVAPRSDADPTLVVTPISGVDLRQWGGSSSRSTRRSRTRSRWAASSASRAATTAPGFGNVPSRVNPTPIVRRPRRAAVERAQGQQHPELPLQPRLPGGPHPVEPDPRAGHRRLVREAEAPLGHAPRPRVRRVRSSTRRRSTGVHSELDDRAEHGELVRSASSSTACSPTPRATASRPTRSRACCSPSTRSSRATSLARSCSRSGSSRSSEAASTSGRLRTSGPAGAALRHPGRLPGDDGPHLEHRLRLDGLLHRALVGDADERVEVLLREPGGHLDVELDARERAAPPGRGGSAGRSGSPRSGARASGRTPRRRCRRRCRLPRGTGRTARARSPRRRPTPAGPFGSRDSRSGCPPAFRPAGHDHLARHVLSLPRSRRCEPARPRGIPGARGRMLASAAPDES